jgi:RNase H-fold protein (predicted Holliday junction resolvase)
MLNVDNHFKMMEKEIYYAFVDETSTTKYAKSLLNNIAQDFDFYREESKDDEDTIAAALILEMFLQELNNDY